MRSCLLLAERVCVLRVGRETDVCDGDNSSKFYAGGEVFVSGTLMTKHFPGENEIFHERNQDKKKVVCKIAKCKPTTQEQLCGEDMKVATKL